MASKRGWPRAHWNADNARAANVPFSDLFKKPLGAEQRAALGAIVTETPFSAEEIDDAYRQLGTVDLVKEAVGKAIEYKCPLYWVVEQIGNLSRVK